MRLTPRFLEALLHTSAKGHALRQCESPSTHGPFAAQVPCTHNWTVVCPGKAPVLKSGITVVVTTGANVSADLNLAGTPSAVCSVALAATDAQGVSNTAAATLQASSARRTARTAADHGGCAGHQPGASATGIGWPEAGPGAACCMTHLARTRGYTCIVPQIAVDSMRSSPHAMPPTDHRAPRADRRHRGGPPPQLHRGRVGGAQRRHLALPRRLRVLRVAGVLCQRRNRCQERAERQRRDRGQRP